MAEASYILGRKKYARPQALLLSDSPAEKVVLNEGTPEESFLYLPPGFEVNSENFLESNTTDNFLILSDHNRGEISFSTDRIEKRERMINGRMRSYHVADKLNLSVSWQNLPSRSFSQVPNFNDVTGKTSLRTSGQRSPGEDGSFSVLPNSTASTQQYTVDGGAGGADLLDWYENHQGSFWVYLAYDKPQEFASESNPYGHLGKYTEFVEVFFSDFQYSVVKRGASNHDFWDVNISLEEV